MQNKRNVAKNVARKEKKKKEITDYQQLPFFLLSGLLDSNQRPRAPQTCALPTALNPDPVAMSGVVPDLRVQRYDVFLN